MRRVGMVALAGALALGALVGCGPEGAGVVIKRERQATRGEDWYVITIRRDDNGKPEKGKVMPDDYQNCQIGDRWPDCKTG